MTWTLSQSGTTSALSINSETQLGSNDTNNATFVLVFDSTNMANNDILEARIYTIVLNGGSLIQCWKGTWANVQTSPIKISPPIASDQSLKVTLKQTAGTGRTYAWKLLRV